MVRKVRGLIVIPNVLIHVMPSSRDAKIQKQFGACLRSLRLAKGLSQESLAHACNLDRTYIGSVERGERNISLINIHILAAALGIPVADLFNA